MRMTFLYLCACLILTIQSASAQVAKCPISDSEKKFVEEAVDKFVLDALFTAGSSSVHPGGFPGKVDVAYSSTLLGQIRFGSASSDIGLREHASLTELCTEPKTFDRTCRSQNTEPQEQFWKEQDVCVQIGCEAKGIYKAQIDWNPLPGENPGFVYNATQKRQITYDPPSSITWRLNDQIPHRLIVTGDFLSSAKIEYQDGTLVPATYTGTVTAVSTRAQGLSSFVLHMTFPGIGPRLPVRADLQLHRHDATSANGTIALGENVLATLTLLPAEPLQISWSAACD